jgi:hypothetical protein
MSLMRIIELQGQSVLNLDEFYGNAGSGAESTAL